MVIEFMAAIPALVLSPPRTHRVFEVDETSARRANPRILAAGGEPTVGEARKAFATDVSKVVITTRNEVVAALGLPSGTSTTAKPASAMGAFFESVRVMLLADQSG